MPLLLKMIMFSYILAILLDPYCLLRLYSKNKPTVPDVSHSPGFPRVGMPWIPVDLGRISAPCLTWLAGVGCSGASWQRCSSFCSLCVTEGCAGVLMIGSAHASTDMQLLALETPTSNRT